LQDKSGKLQFRKTIH